MMTVYWSKETKNKIARITPHTEIGVLFVLA